MRGKAIGIFVVFFSLVFQTAASTIIPPDSCPDHTGKIAPYLIPVLWNDIEFTNEIPQVQEKVLIVTNRELISRKNHLMFNNHRNKDKVYYLVVFKKGDKWMIQQASDFEEAFAQVDDLSPNLFYVHGYGTSFPGVISEALTLKRFYNVSVIAFDWPSKIPNVFALTNYRIARKNVLHSTPAFAQTIKAFNAYKKNHWNGYKVNSSLLLHSMGNILLRESIKKGLLSGKDFRAFRTIVLNAPAVQLAGHKKWVEKLTAEKVYITSDKKDWSFIGLWFLTFKRQLGGSDAKKNAANAFYINFEKAAGNNHNYFLNAKIMQKDAHISIFYRSLFHNKKIDLKNECLFQKTDKNTSSLN